MKSIQFIRNTVFALIAGITCVIALAGPVLAVPTITWTGNNYPWDMSADGSVVVGNTGEGTYETFRWTELTGEVRLGMSTSGVAPGAGTPDVSDDGNHVSATIITADSTYATQGIWSKGIGWERSMPPLPPSPPQLVPQQCKIVPRFGLHHDKGDRRPPDPD